MPKRNTQVESEMIRSELEGFIADFKDLLQGDELRPKVLALAHLFNQMRSLGIAVALDHLGDASSARGRILAYLQKYVGQLIQGDELLVVSGIQEYARRIRELRVEFGWSVISGDTIAQMVSAGDLHFLNGEKVQVDSYLLLSSEQDKEAAYRWNLIHSIRKDKSLTNAKDKILYFLRQNVGKPVSGEELRYVANHISEWARRVRELRTEQGWPVYSSGSGRGDIPAGMYILESDVQSEIHDRKIQDATRIQVLERDQYRCRKCQWSRKDIFAGDPRKMLELHHVIPHVKKGDNEVDNLVTLCNVCHDEVHRIDKKNTWTPDEMALWLNA